MGKQVKFFMLPRDENRFFEFLSNDSDVKLILPTSDSPNLSVVETKHFPFIKGAKCYIWDTGFDIKPHIKKSIRKVYDEKLGQLVNTDQAIYTISAMNAPVIEYLRSFVDGDGVLVSGRIWAEMYEMNKNKAIIQKGKNFQARYTRLATWLRKNLKRIKGVEGYFGDEALQWFQNGREIKS